MTQLRVHIEVKGDGKDGEEHDKEDPGNFRRRIPRPVDHGQGHNKAQQHGAAIEGVISHAVESHKEEDKLDSQQQEDHGGPAEDQAEEASFSPVEEENSLLIQGLFFFFHSRFSLFFLYHSTTAQ